MGSWEKGSRIIRIRESGMRVVLVGMMMMVSSTTCSVVELMDPKISYTPTSTTSFMTLLRGGIQSWLSSPPYPFIAMILILLLIIINILVSSSPSPLSSGLWAEEFTLESYYYPPPQEIWSEEGKGSAAGDHGEVVGGGGEDEYQRLEETWKAITNGAGVRPPAAGTTTRTTRLQQVRISKCEAWRDVLPPCEGGGGGDSSDSRRREKMMKKSNTFVEGGGGGRRWDSSGYRSRKGGGHDELMLSQDELNKRVEEFIRKCKNKMRLERLESDER